MSDKLMIKKELTEIVSPIHFTEEMKQNVLNKAKPSIWEREITISIPLAAITIILMIGIGAISLPSKESVHSVEQVVKNQVTSIDTGTFWESDLKGVRK